MPDVQVLDAAAYLEFAKSGLESQLSAAGAELKDTQISAYTNGKTGDEYTSLKVQFEAQGAPMYEELVCLKVGDYFMTTSATAPDKAVLDKILENFALIK